MQLRRMMMIIKSVRQNEAHDYQDMQKSLVN